MTSSSIMSRMEMERLRDNAAREAESLLYNTAMSDPHYAAVMSAAAAHASLAVYWQARIEWDHARHG